MKACGDTPRDHRKRERRHAPPQGGPLDRRPGLHPGEYTGPIRVILPEAKKAVRGHDARAVPAA
ncbi:hypothetical protein SLA_1056 [Streptomyces laurentii]|uniref:Uncharacterized protein n=1 Tax=Streptomyces laurentii TaxID=39478 RepID=A0A160NU09_STRLU|nr:hypothetical protein SLA_1056 [Streptomyces laurentii]